MKELDLLRQELLSCDTQLVDILMKRFDVVEKIMALKEKNQMQILQPEQENRQKEALDIELKGNVHQEEIADIYERVLYNSKKIQGKKLFDYNIVLIGFMGAGKSTISAFLRDALAMDVVEMDQVIAEQQGMSISEIFETYGEEYFRNLETQLLIDMQSKQNVIISCGGGVAMRERNVAEMKKNGKDTSYVRGYFSLCCPLDQMSYITPLLIHLVFQKPHHPFTLTQPVPCFSNCWGGGGR